MPSELIHTGTVNLPWASSFFTCYRQWMRDNGFYDRDESLRASQFAQEIGIDFTFELKRRALPGVGPFPNQDAWLFTWATEQERTMFMLRFM